MKRSYPDPVTYLKATQDHIEAEAIWEKENTAYNNGNISQEAWLQAKINWHNAESVWYKTKISWHKANFSLHKFKVGTAKEAELKSGLLAGVTRSKLKEIRQHSCEMEGWITRLPNNDKTERTWNFRDDNNRQFFGDIPEEQRVITLTLNWKLDANAEAKPIGKYKLDIKALLAEGYVQKSKRGIRLRFQRKGNNIEIAINRSSPALVVGKC
jgi:hypothetical protein